MVTHGIKVLYWTKSYTCFRFGRAVDSSYSNQIANNEGSPNGWNSEHGCEPEKGMDCA
jgi:hypothetical protein